MFAFWVCHVLKSLFFLSVEGFLAQVGVVLDEFQLIGGVLFVFGCDDVMLVVFCAYESDNFSLFAFLFCHGKPPGRADCLCAKGYYGRTLVGDSRTLGLKRSFGLYNRR